MSRMFWSDLMARVCASFEQNKSWSQEHCAFTGFQYLPTATDLVKRLQIPQDTWIVRPNICADGFVFDNPSVYRSVASLLRKVKESGPSRDNDVLATICQELLPDASTSKIQLVSSMAVELTLYDEQKSGHCIGFCDELSMIYWYSKRALHFKRPNWSGNDQKDHEVPANEIEFDMVASSDLLWDKQNGTSSVPVTTCALARSFFDLVLELTSQNRASLPSSSNLTESYSGQSIGDVMQSKRDVLFTHMIRHPYVFVMGRVTLRFRNSMLTVN